MVNHQIILSLNDLKTSAQTFKGKQQFNVHYIDTVVSPGDYQLSIDQPTSFDSESPDYCGIFSFHSKITPLSLMNEGSGKITQGRCEIKQVLPGKVYSQKKDTKDGYEYFINSKGTFSRIFNNVLFKKSAESSIIPEFDKIQLEVKEDSLISLMF